jgi:hypothetical protein
MSEDNPLAGLNSADVSLIQTAKTGEGAIPITKELAEQISASLKARFADIAERYPALVEACPYEMKLAVIAWAFRHICDHAEHGGTFRYLIYDRMGFGPDAYVPLYDAGGMDISNEFDLSKEP